MAAIAQRIDHLELITFHFAHAGHHGKTNVMPRHPKNLLLSILVLLVFWPAILLSQGVQGLKRDFPNTDLETRSVDLDELWFDGTTRDSIPPVTNPRYARLTDVTDIGEFEPVLSIILNGEARAYPLRILLWHEIVNDTVGGVPILVSYCPLCNSGVIFDRRVGDRLLEFGNTGRIRRFDMVMYDHQTESFWQQFTGDAIVGDMTGAVLSALPSRLESLASFASRAPLGLVLVPTNALARPYGRTPYEGMDTASAPRLMAQYDLPDGINALDYVVVVGNRAWPVDLVRRMGRISQGGINLAWTPGRNSIHDQQTISDGRDIGNIVVTNQAGQHVTHDVTFAFTFSAFRPGGEWMTGTDE